MTTLTLRGVSTDDALIEMEVPEKYAHITKEIEMMDGLGRKKVIIAT